MNKKKVENNNSELNINSRSNKESEPKQINSLIKEAMDNLQLVCSKENRVRGLNTGFKELDKITSGWNNGELIIISGRPAMGKTSFILSQIFKMSVDYQIPVAFFSLEQTDIQITNKLISICCGISGIKIKNGRLEAHEWEHLDLEIKKLYDAPIFIETPIRITIQELCENTRKLVLEKGVKAIFIDYVQLITINNQYNENRYSEINYISRELKILARELNVPIIVISQMNRNIEIDKNRQGIEGKRPVLTDLRDSGTLCDDADIVCFIHRPEYYRITEDEMGNSLIGLAEIIVAKQRNGVTGDIRLRYISETSTFQDLEKPKPFNPENFSSFFNEEVPF